MCHAADIQGHEKKLPFRFPEITRNTVSYPSSSAWPSLDGKAFDIRITVAFLAGECELYAMANPGDVQAELLSWCLNSLNYFLTCLPSEQDILTPHESKVAESHGRNFLLSYAALAHLAKQGGRNLFKIRPKHHQFDHILYQVEMGFNTVAFACWLDETMMGKLALLCRFCQPLSLGENAIWRYLVRLHVQMHDILKEAGEYSLG